MKINILGTEWIISTAKKKDDNEFNSGLADGWTDNTRKLILLMDEQDYSQNIDRRKYRNQILRHELIHAFLFESGLDNEVAWNCEAMVDWLAIQSPKIFKLFKELELL